MSTASPLDRLIDRIRGHRPIGFREGREVVSPDGSKGFEITFALDPRIGLRVRQRAPEGMSPLSAIGTVLLAVNLVHNGW
jgi:hypothetical protein